MNYMSVAVNVAYVWYCSVFLDQINLQSQYIYCYTHYVDLQSSCQNFHSTETFIQPKRFSCQTLTCCRNVVCELYFLNLCSAYVSWGPSWSWSCGSCLSNRYLSSLMLWVQISITPRCTTLCDKVYQLQATDRWFSPGPPVFSTNKTDLHDINEILLKMAINIIKPTKINPGLLIFTLVYIYIFRC